MTDIVVPRVVPNFPRIPLETDAPQVFDDSAKDMAKRYPDVIGGMNNASSDTYQNALAVSEFADAMQTLWGQVSDGVITIQQALAAIQAGPVVSVNGRSGVVTGLIETVAVDMGTGAMTNAALGQSAIYQSSGAAGVDWPTAMVGARWVVETIGVAGGATQTASQTNVGTQQGWVFERFLQASAWSPWRRVFTSNALIETVKRVTSVGGSTYVVDPGEASVHDINITQATTISMYNARADGDQVTLVLRFVGGAWPVSFTANVKNPIGGVPAPVSGDRRRFVLVGCDAPYWDLVVGPRHAS